MVSNWLRCQIGPGVKLTLLHSWCQIGMVSNWCRCQIDSFTLLVSNWYRCQIDSFTLLVSNCPPHTLGVKLTPVSNWCRCQIVLQPFMLHFLFGIFTRKWWIFPALVAGWFGGLVGPVGGSLTIHFFFTTYHSRRQFISVPF